LTLIDGPARSRATVILAHGAGAPMDSPFMDFMASELAEKKLRVVRFEFPYMQKRRGPDGKKRPPDRAPVLREAWLEIIKAQGKRRVVIGGKSMGGRIASLVADEAVTLGLVCLGYPFHPIGKPNKLRVEHLQSIETPTLILQGERDPFGNLADVATYSLSTQVSVDWLPDGDHSFKPRKSSGHTEEENWTTVVERLANFVDELLA